MGDGEEMGGLVGRRESGVSVRVERAGESGRLGQLAERLLREVAVLAAGQSSDSSRAPPPRPPLPPPPSVSDSASAAGSLSWDRSTVPDQPTPLASSTPRKEPQRSLQLSVHRYDTGTKVEERWSRFPAAEGQPDVWLWSRCRLSLDRATGARMEESLRLLSGGQKQRETAASSSSMSSVSSSAASPDNALRLDYNLSKDGRRGHLRLRPVPPALFLNGIQVLPPPPNHN